MYRHHRTIITALSVISLLLLPTLLGCRRPPDPIKIGLIAPLSGDLADEMGEATQNSAEMAVQEVNDAGGLLIGDQRYPLLLIVEDNGSTPEQSAAAAQKLSNVDRVSAIVGPPTSRNAIAAAQVAELAGVPLISPTSTNPATTAGKQYIFRGTFLDDVQAMAMARFSLEQLGASRAAVLFDVSNSYNRGLAERYLQAFTAGGGEVVAFESYTSDQEKDFSQQLGRIQAASPELLFLPNGTDDVMAQGAAAREMGIDAVIIGSDSWLGERLTGQPGFEEAYFSGHYCRDTRIEPVRLFAETYQRQYGQVANGLVALTYDSFGLLFGAMQLQGKSDSESIRDGLRLIEYHGVTGPISYHTGGDPVKKVAIWKIDHQERFCVDAVAGQ